MTKTKKKKDRRFKAPLTRHKTYTPVPRTHSYDRGLSDELSLLSTYVYGRNNT